jgi:hypothetical protein
MAMPIAQQVRLGLALPVLLVASVTGLANACTPSEDDAAHPADHGGAGGASVGGAPEGGGSPEGPTAGNDATTTTPGDDSSGGTMAVAGNASQEGGGAGIQTGGAGGESTTSAPCLIQGSCRKLDDSPSIKVVGTCNDLGMLDEAEQQEAETDCTGGGDVWSSSPCTENNSSGGCLLVNPNFCAIVWDRRETAEIYEAACVARGGVFVPPH